MATSAYIKKSMIVDLLGRDEIKKRILAKHSKDEVLDLYIDKLNADDLRNLLKDQ